MNGRGLWERFWFKLAINNSKAGRIMADGSSDNSGDTLGADLLDFGKKIAPHMRRTRLKELIVQARVSEGVNLYSGSSWDKSTAILKLLIKAEEIDERARSAKLWNRREVEQSNGSKADPDIQRDSSYQEDRRAPFEIKKVAGFQNIERLMGDPDDPDGSGVWAADSPGSLEEVMAFVYRRWQETYKNDPAKVTAYLDLAKRDDSRRARSLGEWAAASGAIRARLAAKRTGVPDPERCETRLSMDRRAVAAVTGWQVPEDRHCHDSFERHTPDWMNVDHRQAAGEAMFEEVHAAVATLPVANRVELQSKLSEESAEDRSDITPQTRHSRREAGKKRLKRERPELRAHLEQGPTHELPEHGHLPTSICEDQTGRHALESQFGLLAPPKVQPAENQRRAQIRQVYAATGSAETTAAELNLPLATVLTLLQSHVGDHRFEEKAFNSEAFAAAVQTEGADESEEDAWKDSGVYVSHRPNNRPLKVLYSGRAGVAVPLRYSEGLMKDFEPYPVNDKQAGKRAEQLVRLRAARP